VPEHFSYLIKRGAPPEHVDRQTMAQQVRAPSGRDHSCFCQGRFDDARNGTPTFEPVDGSLIAEEHSTTGASRPIMAQITRKGSCDIRRERQLRPFSTFPAHGDSRVFPIDIFEVESDDFTRPQAKPREQKQDGVIASSHRRASVAMMQEPPYLVTVRRNRVAPAAAPENSHVERTGWIEIPGRFSRSHWATGCWARRFPSSLWA